MARKHPSYCALAPMSAALLAPSAGSPAPRAAPGTSGPGNRAARHEPRQPVTPTHINLTRSPPLAPALSARPHGKSELTHS